MAIAASLDRFLEAQAPIYATALGEIRRGAKRSHWMWFVFPQLTSLGRSSTAQYYGIASIAVAIAYLDHPVLGARYVECVEALQDLSTSDAVAVFGETDAMKLRSSLTLFEMARPTALFDAALARWFRGERDPHTLALIAAAPGA
ncbi:DUF1810 domain-containing protein [Sphingomonas immobilis]|uniref:DUF1810 domain-containing protein n=1 Tax=Sphingomonas immobilis TaxID=3063997 RepID=A0ABT8ZW42_9SPHN|nr:DUF1810 domain-containing protein [Sphingomonas sp. CA1-15]MDO7841795.1 DUF1810 domain-containing protein [Sphingomonas sp. CA1-15]